jgi:hypothetical protein
MGNSGMDREVRESSRRLLVFLQQRFGIFADVQAAAQFDTFSTADIPLSAFELSEEDMPVVVPYDEVVAVLGTCALNNTDTINDATVSADDDVDMTAQHHASAASSSSGRADSTQLQPTAAVAAAMNGSTSASAVHELQQHSSARSRWQEMNAMLDEVNVSNLSIKQSQQQRQQHQQQQYSASLVAAYPALFAAVDSSVGEDVVMAAARLVSTEQAASASERAAQKQAVAFLEQEVSRDSSELWSQLHAQPAAS